MKHEPEPSRVREHGTHVTRSATPEEKIAAFRSIVARGGYSKIDGVTVDLFSASAVVAVYDALNDANKAKFAGLSVPKMATVAFKLLK